MESNTLLYLISFRAVTNKFITTVTGMGDIIKAKNKHGINYIKLFDPDKDRFVKISKENLKSQTGYYTHTYQELLKTNYIKD